MAGGVGKNWVFQPDSFDWNFSFCATATPPPFFFLTHGTFLVKQFKLGEPQSPVYKMGRVLLAGLLGGFGMMGDQCMRVLMGGNTAGLSLDFLPLLLLLAPNPPHLRESWA